MKYIFTTFLLFTFFSASASYAALKPRTCFVIEDNTSLAIDWNAHGVREISVHGVLGNFEDINPVQSTITLQGRCHDTQGGNWVCDPDMTVPYYTHFQYGHLKSLYLFQQEEGGRIRMNDGLDYEFYSTDCP